MGLYYCYNSPISQEKNVSEKVVCSCPRDTSFPNIQYWYCWDWDQSVVGGTGISRNRVLEGFFVCFDSPCRTLVHRLVMMKKRP
jgi:hypothetical protein